MGALLPVFRGLGRRARISPRHQMVSQLFDGKDMLLFVTAYDGCCVTVLFRLCLSLCLSGARWKSHSDLSAHFTAEQAGCGFKVSA